MNSNAQHPVSFQKKLKITRENAERVAYKEIVWENFLYKVLAYTASSELASRQRKSTNTGLDQFLSIFVFMYVCCVCTCVCTSCTCMHCYYIIHACMHEYAYYGGREGSAASREKSRLPRIKEARLLGENANSMQADYSGVIASIGHTVSVRLVQHG